VFTDIDRRISDPGWLKGLCLSPRGVIGRKKDINRSPYGFSCCNQCKTSIRANFIPFYAIVNRNYVGHAAECLKELREVEVAFISPVRGYGYYSAKIQQLSFCFCKIQRIYVVKSEYSPIS
jgi:hypothetical protein